jgi:hypothetical protein
MMLTGRIPAQSGDPANLRDSIQGPNALTTVLRQLGVERVPVEIVEGRVPTCGWLRLFRPTVQGPILQVGEGESTLLAVPIARRSWWSPPSVQAAIEGAAQRMLVGAGWTGLLANPTLAPGDKVKLALYSGHVGPEYVHVTLEVGSDGNVTFTPDGTRSIAIEIGSNGGRQVCLANRGDAVTVAMTDPLNTAFWVGVTQNGGSIHRQPDTNPPAQDVLRWHFATAGTKLAVGFDEAGGRVFRQLRE